MAECPYPSRASLEAAMFWAVRLNGPLSQSPRWAARVTAAGGQTQERSDEKEPEPRW